MPSFLFCRPSPHTHALGCVASLPFPSLLVCLSPFVCCCRVFFFCVTSSDRPMRPTESDTEKNQINPTHKHAPTRQAKRTTMVPSGAQAAAAAAMADALPAISHVQSSPSGSGSVSISLPSRGWSILRTTRSASKAELAGESPATPLFYSILVHNLSHSDLMLGLRSPPDATPAAATAAVRASQGTPTSATSTANIQPPLPTSIIARPKFSRFKQISGRLLTYVENQQMQMTGIEFPSPLATRLQGNGRPQTCPYGFRVKDGQMKFQDWEAFKVRTRARDTRRHTTRAHISLAPRTLMKDG